MKHVVRSLLAALTAATLAACGGSSTAYPPPSVPLITPAPSPTPQANQNVGSSPIAHVIVVVMENRTPDNLFCTGFPALTSPASAGQPYPGMNLQCPGATNPATWTSLASPADPSHSYPALVAEWDNGKMDGFAKDPVSIFGSTAPAAPIPGFTNTYVPPNETVIYSALAATYASAANMFSSGLVPSFPGHQYLFAGQSGTPEDPPTAIWGCDAPAGSTTPSFGPNYTYGPNVSQCFDYQSIADLANVKGVTWRYYTGAPKTVDGNVDAVGAISHLRFGSSFANVVTPPDAIDGALQNCQLPSIAFVTAPAFASDHSATLSAGGPGFVGDIYLNLIQTLSNANPLCQYYNNTAMIVTWDDSGGWYDHVVPPIDGTTGRSYGFRVPLIVISPYANHPASAPVFVSQQNYFTFGSILKYIENTFSLGNLGAQDAIAGDLNTGNLQTSLFNYQQTPIKPLAGLLLQSFKQKITESKATMRTPAGTPVDDDR